MPPKKEVETTPKAAPKKRAPRKTVNSAAKTVASNTRHIDENTREISNNTKLIYILFGIIIFLAVLLAALAFYIGTIYGNKGANTSGGAIVPQSQEDIKITVIDDSRCSDCQVDTIIEQLKSQPFLTKAEFKKKDFSDKGVKEMMEENNLRNIPTVLFNTNVLNDGGKIASFLQSTPSGKFSLALPEMFNPFEKRSENGLLIMDDRSGVDAIIDAAYIKGNKDAKITILEYSDMQCPYCAKMNRDGTKNTLLEAYPEDLNVAFQHFPLDFHGNAQVAAEILECVGEQLGSEGYYALIEKSFSEAPETGNGLYNPNETSSKENMLAYAKEVGANESEVTACLDAGKYTQKVKDSLQAGQTLFGITGTPGNVIFNNETGEYEIISGAYDADAFKSIIDKMLK